MASAKPAISPGSSPPSVCARCGGKIRREAHPTQKPVDLMRWLAILTMTPTGGLVLDPFAGSGTTGVACNIVGRPWVLIEQDSHYCDIARKRCAQQGLFNAVQSEVKHV